MTTKDYDKLMAVKQTASYSLPILAFVAYFLGGLALLAGIGGAFLMKGPERWIILSSGLGAAIWLFGLGQVVDLIGRAAHHAGRAADQQALILHEIRQLIQRIQ